MKTNRYIVEFQNYKNFQAFKRKLKGMPYKYVESTRKCVVSPVKNVIDYEGEPFKIGMHDKELQDFFLRLYSIKYETTLRILPA